MCFDVNDDTKFVRLLKYVVDAGGLLILPVDCLLLQPLRIATFRLLELHIHEEYKFKFQ
jgi:hypothetical protein